MGTGELQICVGIGRNHPTAPRPRYKAIKAIFVAFISIFESKHAQNDKIRALTFKTYWGFVMKVALFSPFSPS